MPEPGNILEFEDNKHLPELFGQHEANLVKLEKSLNIQIVARGNQLHLSGDMEACEKAAGILRKNYDKLASGRSIAAQEFDRGSQFSGGGDGGKVAVRRRQIEPRSENQAAYFQHLQENELVFGIGPAGTGKTYLAVAMAAAMLLDGHVDRLILSRPAVEAGERLGFLPGDMREKVDPYLRPLYDALYDMMPAEQVSRKLESGEIEVAPLAFMRGRTLANAFVILDEAQNCTPVQMKMFLTRLGENSRMAITGDPSQVDLPLGSKSGLMEAVDLLSNVKGVGHTRFTNEDVVRHPLVERIVKAYAKAEGKLLS
ncbi:MAG: PhoH family protein [SAR116 cluster bacterium]|nr:phosphate starvation-inducible protein PhoH [Paracoccaceae bacterium]RCL81662.1 MAG: PhoH family protein [SAR116 cluster bacterium]RPH13515.1 MAG: PhoH family protein [Alphaproteobacteria bacterium TMED150]